MGGWLVSCKGGDANEHKEVVQTGPFWSRSKDKMYFDIESCVHSRSPVLMWFCHTPLLFLRVHTTFLVLKSYLFELAIRWR